MSDKTKDANQRFPVGNGLFSRRSVLTLSQWFCGIVMSIVCIVSICLGLSLYDRTWAQEPIYIVAGDKKIDAIEDTIGGDNGNANMLDKQFLEKSRAQGVLMTSDEFASRITSYYNTLVAVLGVMVAVFTFASSFLVSNFYRNEFERERLRIVADLEEGISKKVSWALRDSLEVRRTVAENIRGDIEPYFTQVETTEDMIKQLTDHDQKLSDIGRQLADLQESVPSKLEVIVGDAGKHGDHGC